MDSYPLQEYNGGGGGGGGEGYDGGWAGGGAPSPYILARPPWNNAVAPHEPVHPRGANDILEELMKTRLGRQKYKSSLAIATESNLSHLRELARQKAAALRAQEEAEARARAKKERFTAKQQAFRDLVRGVTRAPDGTVIATSSSPAPESPARARARDLGGIGGASPTVDARRRRQEAITALFDGWAANAAARDAEDAAAAAAQQALPLSSPLKAPQHATTTSSASALDKLDEALFEAPLPQSPVRSRAGGAGDAASPRAASFALPPPSVNLVDDVVPVEPRVPAPESSSASTPGGVAGVLEEGESKPTKGRKHKRRRRGKRVLDALANITELVTSISGASDTAAARRIAGKFKDLEEELLNVAQRERAAADAAGEAPTSGAEGGEGGGVGEEVSSGGALAEAGAGAAAAAAAPPSSAGGAKAAAAAGGGTQADGEGGDDDDDDDDGAESDASDGLDTLHTYGTLSMPDANRVLRKLHAMKAARGGGDGASKASAASSAAASLASILPDAGGPGGSVWETSAASVASTLLSSSSSSLRLIHSRRSLAAVIERYVKALRVHHDNSLAAMALDEAVGVVEGANSER